MAVVYLFRIDGARDNDEFFAELRTTASHVYAGLDFRVGAPGWVPDLVKVVVEQTPGRCCLTLIELEATESVALVSARKYLPEKSADIVGSFAEYLDRVIRECRTSADPREPEFIRLKAILGQAPQTIVSTAGGLRSPARIVEELPLIDQDSGPPPPIPAPMAIPEPTTIFQVELRLSQSDGRSLARSVMILDAVIRGRDHSSASFQAWRSDPEYQPMKRLLAERQGNFPALRILILGRQNSGITVDFEQALSELVEIWSATESAPFDAEHARQLVTGYFPIAERIRANEPMAAVFGAGRAFLVDVAADHTGLESGT
jgi:hypothetical protein